MLALRAVGGKGDTTLRDDRYTTTPEDAAAWERDHAYEEAVPDPYEVLDGRELYEYLHREPRTSSSRIMRRIRYERYDQ